ncbi:ABC transporter permease [Lacticaseibacillus rhamnosus]
MNPATKRGSLKICGLTFRKNLSERRSELSVLIAIFVGVNLLYKELDLKTVYTILPKPIARWQFVLGKWLGMLITLALQIPRGEQQLPLTL